MSNVVVVGRDNVIICQSCLRWRTTLLYHCPKKMVSALKHLTRAIKAHFWKGRSRGDGGIPCHSQDKAPAINSSMKKKKALPRIIMGQV